MMSPPSLQKKIKYEGKWLKKMANIFFLGLFCETKPKILIKSISSVFRWRDVSHFARQPRVPKAPFGTLFTAFTHGHPCLADAKGILSLEGGGGGQPPPPSNTTKGAEGVVWEVVYGLHRCLPFFFNKLTLDGGF